MLLPLTFNEDKHVTGWDIWVTTTYVDELDVILYGVDANDKSPKYGHKKTGSIYC